MEWKVFFSFLVVLLLGGNPLGAAINPSTLKSTLNTPPLSAGPLLRVRIGNKLQSVVLTGMDVQGNWDNKAQVFAGKKTLKFNCMAANKSDSIRPPLLLASLNANAGLITWMGQKYSGNFDIISTPDYQSCDLIQEIQLEHYLSTLLAKEMNSSWPLEALKAQAVLARTYAIYKQKHQTVSKILGVDSLYDLENSEKHQVSGSFFDTNQQTDLAVHQTRGEILVAKGSNLTEVFYHAQCGGKTILPEKVWNNSVEGHQSVPCPYCQNHAHQHPHQGEWVWQIHQNTLKKFLLWVLEKKSILDKYEKMQLAQDRFEHDVLRLYLDAKMVMVEKSYFRRYFGASKVKSNRFVVEMRDQTLLLKGRGLGHGVGMCQRGALYFARQGLGYRDILAYYYPGHIIEQHY